MTDVACVMPAENPQLLKKRIMHNPEILLDGKADNMVRIRLITTCVSQSKEDHYA
jgi:hypothetical protein